MINASEIKRAARDAAKRLLAALLALFMIFSMLELESAYAAAGDGTYGVELEKGATYSVPFEIFDASYSLEQRYAENGLLQFDRRALVTPLEDGGYRLRFLLESNSLVSFVQVLDPTKNTAAYEKYQSKGTGLFLSIPYGTYNCTVEAAEILANYSLQVGSDDPAITAEINDFYLKDVSRDVADATLDTGYVTFTVPSLETELYVGAFAYREGDALRTNPHGKYGSGFGFVDGRFFFCFDKNCIESAIELPEDLTYEQGTYAGGYGWTNYKVGASTDLGISVNPAALAYLNSIFENEVEVSVDNGGQLEAAFTLKTDLSDPVAKIEVITARDPLGSGPTYLYTDVSPYSTDNSVYEQVPIAGGVARLRFDDLAFGRSLRVTTQSQLTTGTRSAYYGRLHVLPSPAAEDEPIVKMSGGVTMRSDTGSLPADVEFTATESKGVITDKQYSSYYGFSRGDGFIKAYTISLTYNGQVISPKKSVDIEFPIPEGWDLDAISGLMAPSNGSGTDDNIAYFGSVDGEKRVVRVSTSDTARLNASYLILDRGTPVDIASPPLADGLYKARVTIGHNQQMAKTSMSNGTIVDNTGYIEVKDGQARLFYETTFAVAFNMEAYMSAAFVYSDTSSAQTESARIPATVYEYHTTEDGNFDVDLNVKGDDLRYPKRLSLPLINTGRNSDNSYKFSVIVPIMDAFEGVPGSGNAMATARLRIISIEPLAGKNPLSNYDKNVLKAAILDAQALLGTLEEGQRKTELDGAVTVAQSVYDSDPGSQDVDTALAALELAVKGESSGEPSEGVDKSALTAAITQASGYDDPDNTDESYIALRAAIIASEAVLGDADATQAEVDAQVAALQGAIDALVADVQWEQYMIPGAVLATNSGALPATASEAINSVSVRHINGRMEVTLNMKEYSSASGAAWITEIADITGRRGLNAVPTAYDDEGHITSFVFAIPRTSEPVAVKYRHSLMATSTSSSAGYLHIYNPVDAVPAPKLSESGLQSGVAYAINADLWRFSGASKAPIYRMSQAVESVTVTPIGGKMRVTLNFAPFFNLSGTTGTATYVKEITEPSAGIETVVVDGKIESCTFTIDYGQQYMPFTFKDGTNNNAPYNLVFHYGNLRYNAAPGVDKTGLAEQIAIADGYEEDVYTAGTYAALAAAKSQASATMASPTATQSDVDSKAAALKTAALNLERKEPEPKPDKTALKTTLDGANGKAESDYLPLFYASLKSAIPTAQGVYDDPDATEIAIAEQVASLNTALGRLVARTPLADGAYTFRTELRSSPTATAADALDGLIESSLLLVDGGKHKVTLNFQPYVVSGVEQYITSITDPAVGESDPKVIDGVSTLVSYTFDLSNPVEYISLKLFYTGNTRVQTRYLFFFFEDAVAVGGGEPEEVSKTALNAAIASVEALVEAEYTAESWSSLQIALTAAKSAAAKADATQVEINGATTALRDAIDGLAPATQPPITDTTALIAALAEAGAVDGALYTEISYAALQAAISGATTVLNDADATQEQIDAQVTALTTAIAALIEKSADPPPIDIGNLADGEYSIDTELWRFAETVYSMGNGAIDHSRSRIIVADGVAEVRLVFQPLERTLGTIELKGYLSNLWRKDNIVTNNENVIISSDDIPATVYSEYVGVTDDYGPASGWYPEELGFTVTIGQEYTPVQVFVPVMDYITPGAGSQPARLRLDWDSLELISATEPEPIPETDKTALQAALAEADGYASADYTAQTYAALQTAILSAQSVYNDEYATQTQIDAQVAALNAAIGALVDAEPTITPPDTPPLAEIITVEAEAALPDGETTASVTITEGELTGALPEGENAKAVLVLDVAVPENAAAVEVTIPAAALGAVAEAEAPLTISSSVGTLELGAETLAQIVTGAGDVSDVKLSVGTADTGEALNSKQKAKVGSNPVFELSISVDGETFTEEFAAPVTVTLPYTLAPGRNASEIEVYYLDDDGNTARMTLIKYESGYVTFTVPHFSLYYIALAAKNDASPSPGQSGGGDAERNYNVSLALWNASMDQPSMGDAAFSGAGGKALVKASNGKYTLQAATQPVNIKLTADQSFISALQYLQYMKNGVWTDVTVLQKAQCTTDPKQTDSGAVTFDYIRLFEIELDSLGSGTQYVRVRVKVPYTPMGEDWIEARLKIDWTTLVEIAGGNVTLQPQDVEIVETEYTEAFDGTDTATGIRVEAEPGVLPVGAELAVGEIKPDAADSKSKAAYEKADEALKDTAEKFSLWDITIYNADGAEIQPDGRLTLRFPIPEGFDGAKTALYRINDDATATKIAGEVKNGEYVATVTHLSLYAIVETQAPPSDGDAAASEPQAATVSADAPEAAPGGDEAGAQGAPVAQNLLNEVDIADGPTALSDSPPPRTGDAGTAAYAVLFGLALAAMAALAATGRKKRKNTNA